MVSGSSNQGNSRQTNLLELNVDTVNVGERRVGSAAIGVNLALEGLGPSPAHGNNEGSLLGVFDIGGELVHPSVNGPEPDRAVEGDGSLIIQVNIIIFAINFSLSSPPPFFFFLRTYSVLDIKGGLGIRGRDVVGTNDVGDGDVGDGHSGDEVGHISLSERLVVLELNQTLIAIRTRSRKADLRTMEVWALLAKVVGSL